MRHTYTVTDAVGQTETFGKLKDALEDIAEISGLTSDWYPEIRKALNSYGKWHKTHGMDSCATIERNTVR